MKKLKTGYTRVIRYEVYSSLLIYFHPKKNPEVLDTGGLTFITDSFIVPG